MFDLTNQLVQLVQVCGKITSWLWDKIGNYNQHSKLHSINFQGENKERIKLQKESFSKKMISIKRSWWWLFFVKWVKRINFHNDPISYYPDALNMYWKMALNEGSIIDMASQQGWSISNVCDPKIQIWFSIFRFQNLS